MLLMKEALVGIKRNFKRYLSLFLFVLLTVSIFSAMITVSLQIFLSLNTLKNNSIEYDYEMNSQLLTIKYLNTTQKDLQESSFDNETYLGEILSEYNPYPDLNPSSQLYTFAQLKSDIGSSYIVWQNNTWELTDLLPFTIDNSIKQNWIKIISDFPSANLQDDGQKNYIAVDGIENYIFAKLLNDKNSPLYTNDLLSVAPDISYVHKFSYIGSVNNKKIFYLFETNSVPNDSNPYQSSFFSREKVNRIVSMNNEINPAINHSQLFLNKQFAWKNKLSVNDELIFQNQGNTQDYKFKIQGYASSISEAYPLTQDINSSFNDLNTNGLKDGTYVFLNVVDFYYLKENLINQNSKSSSDTTGYIKFDNLSQYQMDDIMIGKKGIFSNFFVNKEGALKEFGLTAAGIIVKNSNLILVIELAVSIISIIVISIIISFFVKKNVEMYYTKIGILKALGYKNNQIAIIFTTSLTSIIWLSFIFGFFASIFFQFYLSIFSIFTIGVNMNLFYFNTQVMLFDFFYVPLFFMLLIFLASKNAVNKNILFLLYNIKIFKKIVKEKRKIVKNRITNTPFMVRLSFSIVSRTLSKWLLAFFISTFSMFLLFFQFSANVFNNESIDNQYSYLNSNVKILSSTNVDQMDSLIFNKTKPAPDDYHTFNWISSDEAIQNFTQDKLADYNEVINIPKPELAVEALVQGITPNQTIDDLDTIFGKQAVNLLFFKEKQYISSNDAYKIIHMTMTIKVDGQDKNVPMWEWIIDNWDTVTIWIKSKLPNIGNDDLIRIYNLIYSLEVYPSISHETYPNIFMGNYMVYDKETELPIIQKSVEWPTDFSGSLFKKGINLDLNGIDTSSESNFYKFYNLYFKNKLTASQVLPELNKKVVIDGNDLSNVVLPVVVSSAIAATKNFHVNDVINFRVNLSNEYENVPCKIVAISKNDVTYNIYCAYNNLNDYMRNYIANENGISLDKIPNYYYNLLLSKGDDKGDSILKIFRNMDIYSPINADYSYKEPTPPPLFTNIINMQKNNFTKMTLINESKNRMDPILDLGPFSSGYANLSMSSLMYLSSQNSVESISLLKNISSEDSQALNYQLILSEVTTVVINIFILFSLISIVFEDNRQTILIMKALGYQVYKVASSILSFYFLVMIIGFPIALLLSYGLWTGLSKYIFYQTGTLFIVHTSLPFFFLAMAITIIIILVNFIYGFITIKNEKVNVITMAL